LGPKTKEFQAQEAEKYVLTFEFCPLCFLIFPSPTSGLHPCLG
jgi:hypothetical protein